MAGYQAIDAVCRAVMALLESEHEPEQFNNAQLEFDVYVYDNFVNSMDAGISLFLYRITVDGHRLPHRRRGPDGQRGSAQLPLNLHFFLTVWSQSASLEHLLAGWMMRVMEDNPILPAGFLNSVAPGVFHSDETVELLAGEIETEDLLHVWERLLPNQYHLSIPYLARAVRVDSLQAPVSGGPVVERTYRYAEDAGE